MDRRPPEEVSLEGGGGRGGERPDAAAGPPGGRHRRERGRTAGPDGGWKQGEQFCEHHNPVMITPVHTVLISNLVGVPQSVHQPTTSWLQRAYFTQGERI